MGVPVQEGESRNSRAWGDILTSEVVPPIELLKLRDPEKFIAGGIHEHPEAWEAILEGHPSEKTILNWIRNKVDILEFSQPFSGFYKGSQYRAHLPPSKSFHNHASCNGFFQFVSQEIVKRVAIGAVRIWGRVGECHPPHLILPLTVEPTKPRVCLDARFLNLWMKDVPFSLDRLTDVPRYVYKGSFMTKCDDKSGYDHVLLTPSSQTYFGFEWGGLWFVCTTLPIGWKISPFIYHSLGLVTSRFVRGQGVPCSLYIDDRLNGELSTQSGAWSVLFANRRREYRLCAAKAALFIVLSVVVELGYTIGISKSVLHSTTTSLEYLGFNVDSCKQSFLVPERKITSWACLREEILAHKKVVDVKTLQRFQGKCIYLCV